MQAKQACLWLSSSFEQMVDQFVEAFESNGIDLVFYFDGLMCPFKRQVSLTRRVMMAKYAFSVLNSLDKYSTRGPSKKILPVLAFESMVGTLHRRGVEVGFSQFEADGDIAQYCAAHPECIGAISNDSDFFICDMNGASYIPLELLQIKRQTNGEWSITCQMFRSDRIASLLNLAKKWMPLFATLVGNDYTHEHSKLHKLHQCMDIYYDETASQVISKVAKFLSRFPPREKNAIDIYNILLERLDKKEQNELLPVLQHSVSMYTFHTTGQTTNRSGDLPLRYQTGINDVLMLEFQLGQFAPGLMSVLADGEFWIGISIFDHYIFDIDEIYLDLRKAIYEILLAHHLKASIESSAESQEKGRASTVCYVDELAQSQHGYYKQRTIKLTLDVLGTHVLPVNSIRKKPDAEKLNFLLSKLRAQSLLEANLERGLLLPCAVMRYLLLEDSGKVEKVNSYRNLRRSPLLIGGRSNSIAGSSFAV